MKAELGSVGATVGASVLAVLFLGLTLAIYPGWAVIGAWSSRADAPAWVQAVGSILAILAAAAIAGWQARTSFRAAEKARQESDRAKAQAIRFILYRGSLVVSNAERVLSSKAQMTASSLALAKDQLHMIQHSIRQLPVFEIPTAVLVFELQRFDRDLLYIERVIRRVEEAGNANLRERPIGLALFERIRARIAEAESTCDAIVGSIDGYAKNAVKNSEGVERCR